MSSTRPRANMSGRVGLLPQPNKAQLEPIWLQTIDQNCVFTAVSHRGAGPHNKVSISSREFSYDTSASLFPEIDKVISYETSHS